MNIDRNDGDIVKLKHAVCIGANRTSAEAGAIVPHDSVNSRPNEGLDDSEGDDLSYNGASSRETSSLGRPDANRPASPPLPSLPEEPNSPSFEGTGCNIHEVAVKLHVELHNPEN